MAILGAVLVFLGLCVWALGRHGLTVGVHPFCRACGFDLYALPLESRRCPECGADIYADNAIRIGYRQPILSALVTGGIIAGIGVVLLTFAFMAWWPKFDGAPYQPATWLMSDLNSSDSVRRTRVCAELQRRISTEALSHQQMDRLGEKVLALQADHAVAWYPRWGDLVQAAHGRDAAHRLSPALWRQYISQAISLSAQARPRIEQGKPVLIALFCRLRAGADTNGLSRVSFTPAISTSLGKITGQVTADSQSPDSHALPLSWNMPWIPTPPANSNATSVEKRIAEFPPGPQTLHLAIMLAVNDSSGLLATHKESLAIPVEILPAGESSVKFIAAPLPNTPDDATTRSLKEQFARSVRLSVIDPDSPENTQLPAKEKVPLMIERGGSLGSLWIASPPICASFSVFLRQNSRNWHIADFMIRPDDAATISLNLYSPSSDFSSPHDRPLSGPATIVCQPNPTTAENTVDVTEIWGQNVELPVNLEMSQ